VAIEQNLGFYRARRFTQAYELTRRAKKKLPKIISFSFYKLQRVSKSSIFLKFLHANWQWRHATELTHRAKKKLPKIISFSFYKLQRVSEFLIQLKLCTRIGSGDTPPS
jgi:hypothetical protein